MYEFKKKNRKVLTSKSVGTARPSYEKSIYRAAVSQRLRNTGLEGVWGIIEVASEVIRYTSDIRTGTPK